MLVPYCWCTPRHGGSDLTLNSPVTNGKLVRPNLVTLYANRQNNQVLEQQFTSIRLQSVFSVIHIKSRKVR